MVRHSLSPFHVSRAVSRTAGTGRRDPAATPPRAGAGPERGPLRSDRTPLPPHPEDVRFNRDGTVWEGLMSGNPRIDAVLAWGLENLGYDERTGSYAPYGALGFERDPRTGRWIVPRSGAEPPSPDPLPKGGKQPPRPPPPPSGKPKREWLQWSFDTACWILVNFGDDMPDHLRWIRRAAR